MDILERSAEVWHYKRGETIAERGDPAPGVWIIASGSTTSHRSTPNGIYFLQGVLWPGDMFGVNPVIDGWPMPLSHSARRDSLIVLIPRAALFETLRDAERMRSFCTQACLSARSTYESVFAACAESVTCRLAKYLSFLPRRAAFDSMGEPGSPTWVDPAPIDLTQDELAAMLGVARQTLNRTLAPFLRQGIVVRDGEQIRVANFRKLLPYMEENEPLPDIWRNQILSWDEHLRKAEPNRLKAVTPRIEARL
ncbi:MAG TPA: Crp/Fnr family transcriptional regulator [Rhizomicrobium sp.]|nr:Crp/Fnr family transcriptional regulator [Rhizomicrobium sp.]